ncbi:MAG TPA: response regulator [Verrucomicrobiae bacterium]|nr:response regulator [Verrucomicrobiae bacterium]
MRALVVDDSKSMRMILGKALREVGFQVAEAGDGREALARLNQGEETDLMLVDWNMPVMNGYELVCAVRANALLSSVRIMMVTTETSMNQLQQALAAGANEYLMKPFTKELLLEKLSLLGIT